MWQLRKLSTNEALSEAGPLPKNWGPISGLSGIQDRIGDLSWIGPNYSDKGWVKLSEDEKKQIRTQKNMERFSTEKGLIDEVLNDSSLTVENKIIWLKYAQELEASCLCPDFDCDPKFPARPNV